MPSSCLIYLLAGPLTNFQYGYSISTSLFTPKLAVVVALLLPLQFRSECSWEAQLVHAVYCDTVLLIVRTILVVLD